MEFSIQLTPSAIEDINYFRKFDRVIVADGIELYLGLDANVESKRRKPLRPNHIASWELRIGEFRVFYDLEDDDKVKIVAVGRKDHNDLFVRGEKVEL